MGVVADGDIEDKDYAHYLSEHKQDDGIGEDEDEEEYDDENMAEDILFISPLDNLDPYVVCQTYFKNLHDTNRELYDHYTSAWGPEEQNLFQSICAQASSSLQQT